ncbi:uncharacterized protein LOC112468078 [Temnothorax curvispinosus]|uniref:Uncharacterized protein LOC112468078 n=1 Tax=Temnothorax curvispinosus TaxID=300111 RepID=A0A6J1RF21_9HYME|nr:uncharacterized protein LOC112468078 [Temnothorax curvispinosus]
MDQLEVIPRDPNAVRPSEETDQSMGLTAAEVQLFMRNNDAEQLDLFQEVPEAVAEQIVRECGEQPAGPENNDKGQSRDEEKDDDQPDQSTTSEIAAGAAIAP